MTDLDRAEPPASAERLVMFTDAVAAIGITLLVLPLVELIPDAVAHREDIGALFHEHLLEFGAFVLSFAVIFRFWWGHHHLFGRIRRVNRPLVLLSALWCFGIVFLPVPTAIITAYTASSATVALYIGTLVLLSGTLTAMAVVAHRHPELADPDHPITRDWILGSGSVLIAQLLALLIGVLFADTVSYWPLALMLLTGPAERLVKARWRRSNRTARATGTGD